jgi:hypothetical protein
MGRHRFPDVRPEPRRRPWRHRGLTTALCLAVTLAFASTALGGGLLLDGWSGARASAVAGTGWAAPGSPARAAGRRAEHAGRGVRRDNRPAVPAPATDAESAAPSAAPVGAAPASPSHPVPAAGESAVGAVGIAAWRAAGAPRTDCTRFVSPSGDDAGPGTAAAPWRHVLQALGNATPGTVVCVLPGTYPQEVVGSPPDGTAAGRIVLESYDPAHPAVLDGRFSLSNLSFWTIRDLRFTNPTPTTPAGATATDNVNARIVALLGGNDVVFEGNEVFGGEYAGLLVSRATATSEIPQRYIVRGNYVHDTLAANLYFNTGRWSTGNLIERNIFAGSGTENAKIGWGDDCRGVSTDSDAFGAGEVEFRYNTLEDGGTAGSFMIAEPGGVYAVRVHHNIFADPQSQRGFVVRYDSASRTPEFPHGCGGDKAFVTDNIGIGGTRFSEDFGDSPADRAHESGNVFPLDPQLGADFVPRNPLARGYGQAAA